MNVHGYQQHSTQNYLYPCAQIGSNFMLDQYIMCHHASRHQSVISSIANALFNYYLFPKAYVYVVSAPIHPNHNTAVVPPASPERPDTAKADAAAKMLFSQVHKASNRLKDLIDSMTAGLSQFEKSSTIKAAAVAVITEAEYLTEQAPSPKDKGAIEAFIVSIDGIENEFIQIQRQMAEFELSQAKSLKEAMTTISNAKKALRGSFAELKKAYDLNGELQNVVDSRQRFWMRRADAASAATDFKAFARETEKHMTVDFFLLSLIEDEIRLAKSKETKLPSHLGILSSISDENFAQKVTSALEKFDMAPLSAEQISEIKTAIIDVLLNVEIGEIALFLDSLADTQKEFAANDYMTVAEHYGETIAQFTSIAATKLNFESIDGYIAEWNELLKEFDQEHQHLLKLNEAEKALKKLSEETIEWLSKNADNRCYDAFVKLNDLASFRYKKNELKDAADVEKHINTIYSFMDEVKKQIALYS